jgi:hypothetical protein
MPTKKAYYLLFLFTEGSAKLWKEQYILQRQGKTLCKADRWEEFRNTLRANFSNVRSKDNALQKLQNMRQEPKQNMDKFNTRFRILAQKAGIDEIENNQILIAFYMQGICNNLTEQILMQDPLPTIMGEWMQKAAILNSHERRAHSFFAQAIKITTTDKGKKGGWKSQHYASKEENWGTPMEIDRLKPQEEEQRREQGLCFTCGKSGHCAADHKKEGGPLSQGNDKGKAPQRQQAEDKEPSKETDKEENQNLNKFGL